MKFTQDFAQCRQLHIEDYLQRGPAEQESYVEGYRNPKMDERSGAAKKEETRMVKR